jgi:hypothetical protein
VLHLRHGEAGGADGIERGTVAVAAHDQPVQPVEPVLRAASARVIGPGVLDEQQAAANDHKAYLLPGQPPHRHARDRRPHAGRVLGLRLFGHWHAEVAEQIDIAAAAIFNQMTVDAISDLDLSYTPPLGSPWDVCR